MKVLVPAEVRDQETERVTGRGLGDEVPLSVELYNTFRIVKKKTCS